MGHLEVIRRAKGLQTKIQQVLERQAYPADGDPDHSLYGGGFFSDDDRRRITEIRSKPISCPECRMP